MQVSDYSEDLYGGDPDYTDYINTGGVANKSGKVNMGFIQEAKLYSQYRTVGMIPQGFTPAGASNTAADLELLVKNYNLLNQNLITRIRVEVKLDTTADYGQSGLKWRAGSHWYITGKQDTASVNMQNMLRTMNIERTVNNIWPQDMPNLFKYNSAREVPDMEKESDKERYKSKMIKGAEFLNTFQDYYLGKNIPYIQIGDYGLYYLKGHDPAGLKFVGASDFNSSGASMKLRIRNKPSGGGNYRFSTALLIDKRPRRSGFDLDGNADMARLQGDAVMCDDAPPQLKKQRLLFQ